MKKMTASIYVYCSTPMQKILLMCLLKRIACRRIPCLAQAWCILSIRQNHTALATCWSCCLHAGRSKAKAMALGTYGDNYNSVRYRGVGELTTKMCPILLNLPPPPPPPPKQKRIQLLFNVTHPVSHRCKLVSFSFKKNYFIQVDMYTY